MDEFKTKLHAIFEKVDPEFGKYFQIMMDEDLLDLESRKNKAPGGYSLGLHVVHRPFVFMNNTNTPCDVQTMLHEGGHAFHEFERAHCHFYQRGENYLPAEFAEVASMSMELLASPYKTKENGGFYTDQEHALTMIELLEDIITFLPYMALVDAFQHWIYENPGISSEASNCEEKWGELWDQYMVGIDYSGLENSKKTYWHRQGHIFGSPFYYVEYGLAQAGRSPGVGECTPRPEEGCFRLPQSAGARCDRASARVIRRRGSQIRIRRRDVDRSPGPAGSSHRRNGSQTVIIRAQRYQTSEV